MKGTSTLQDLYNTTEKIFTQFYKILFLETCYRNNLTPKGLRLSKKCQSVQNGEIQKRWDGVLSDTERILLKITIEEEIGTMKVEENAFWDLYQNLLISKMIDPEWLAKVVTHAAKLEKKLKTQKLKKLRDLCNHLHEDDVAPRFESRVLDFHFRDQLQTLVQDTFPEVEDIVTLANLNNSILNFSQILFEGENLGDVSAMESNPPVDQGGGDFIEGGDIDTTGDREQILESGSERLEGRFVSKNVINLSKRELNKAEISLLSKGLKFIPTPSAINKAKIKENLEIFGRKLRLKWHFRNENNSTVADPFVEKSKFNPRGDTIIEAYLSCLEDKIMRMADSFNPTYNNLTREERLALNTLRDDTSIVIKEADKGSAVVVWDREDYIKEANSQLQDSEVYEETSLDSKFLADIIFQALNKMKFKEEITDKNIEYFMIDNPRLARFYLLPKIHKRLRNVPGRPVVSHVGFHTERISSFIDYHLQPLAQSVKSYVKDTNDFLCKLKGIRKLPNDSIMVTIDVVGLYPSIPHEEGLSALKTALEKRPEKPVSTESLCELAELVLKNNIFEFDEKVYRQLRGTAIGTKMAPPYAIIFLAELEERFLASCEHKPEVWFRYIDDIFMIWTHGEEKLKEFLAALNSFHDTIKFTSEASRETVNFLDVKVSLKDGVFLTDLYVKPTDTHQFLHPASCHPFHCKKAIPFSQALRLNRICSEDDDFENRCEDLYDWLRERGYQHKIVEDQIKRACEFDREELLSKGKPIKKNILSLNIEYNPAFSKLSKVLKELDCILQGDNEHRKVFKETPLIGFSNGKSLKNILVRAVLPKIKSSELEKGSRKCGKPKCLVCESIVNTDEFSSTTTGETFSIQKGPLNCDSPKVVYLITCKICSKQNVGSTDPPYRQRYKNYKSVQLGVREKVLGEARPETKRGRPRKENKVPTKATKKMEKKFAQEKFHKHFCEKGHTGIPDWDIRLIDTAYTEKSLRSKELFWQYKLKTFDPDGLNEYDAPVDTT